MDSVVAFISGVVVLLVGLVVSIGLHEIGHLVPAKRFGVKVTRYKIGFGPTLFRRQRGETEYAVGLIPLGGYVAMVGQYPPGPALTEEQKKRLRGMRALMHDAREAANEGFTPADANRVYYRLSLPKKLTIMLGGPIMNLLLALVLIVIAVTGIGVSTPSTTIASVSPCVSQANTCAPTDPPSPAKLAGLAPGDIIQTINGQKILAWTDVTDLVARSAGENLVVVFDRPGPNGAERMTTLLVPAAADRPVYDASGNPKRQNGSVVTERRGFAGIAAKSVLVPGNLGSALNIASQGASQTIAAVVNLPGKIADLARVTLTGGQRDPDGLVGLVGAGSVAGQISSATGVDLATKIAAELMLLAGLNLMLFFFNLIPLLPFDGGHIAAALYDAARRGMWRIRGRPEPAPFDVARLLPLTMTITVLLLALTGLLVYADLTNPIRLSG